MVIELEILFLTTLLLDHLLNYLHSVTLGGPQSCVLPSPSRGKLVSAIPWGFCHREVLWLCQVGMRFLDYPQCILQKELTRKQNQRQEKSEEFTICSREI